MNEVRHGRRAASRHAAYRIETPCSTPVGKHALPPMPNHPPIVTAPVAIAEVIEPPPNMDSPTNTGMMPRTKLWKAKTIATAVTTGGLLLATGATGATPEAPRSVTQATPIIPMIVAPEEPVTFSRVEIKTEPAPPPPPPPAPVPPPVVQAPAPIRVVPAPLPAPVAAPNAAADRVVSAALGQLGVYQDCTMLVTNSLAAVGINFHGWPREYLNLGYVVHASQALPGDLIYYNNGGSPGPSGIWDHIAVYIGNGQAVHGGFNGNQTIVFSVNVIGAGPTFIRVR